MIREAKTDRYPMSLGELSNV